MVRRPCPRIFLGPHSHHLRMDELIEREKGRYGYYIFHAEHPKGRGHGQDEPLVFNLMVLSPHGSLLPFCLWSSLKGHAQMA